MVPVREFYLPLTELEFILVIYRFHICKLVYKLKFVTPKLTFRAFSVHGNMQSDKKLESPGFCS